jgi:hypothetical protein
VGHQIWLPRQETTGGRGCSCGGIQRAWMTGRAIQGPVIRVGRCEYGDGAPKITNIMCG